MSKNQLIPIRKRFPLISKLLSSTGVIISYIIFNNNILLLLISILLVFLIALLFNMDYSMRLNGRTIELGYSLLWTFRPTLSLAVADVHTLCIQQTPQKSYQVGLLTRENDFIELQRKPTLDVAEKIKTEIEQKIKDSWG